MGWWWSPSAVSKSGIGSEKLSGSSAELSPAAPPWSCWAMAGTATSAHAVRMNTLGKKLDLRLVIGLPFLSSEID